MVHANANPSALALLELREVSRNFGGLVAVDQLHMKVAQGTIHGLIGPNGSGKSTTFNVISGIHRATAGQVFFKGQDITGIRPHDLARKGISRTFQATDLFPEFTVKQNIVLSAELRMAAGPWGILACSRRYRRSENEIAEWAEEIMDGLQLTPARDMIVRDLPHRDQKAVALANALVTGAELLMLDEPAAGLTAQEMEEMMRLFRMLRDGGKTLLLVEHNMRTVMGLCDTITVLNYGRKIAEGSPDEIADDEEVIEAYLGVS